MHSLVFDPEWGPAVKFANKYDFLPIVIDHIAKPKILNHEIDEWKKDMQELSNYENVYCKFSGILTEVGSDYSKKQIDPYVDFILNSFSAKKIMWGSDWPVLTMAENYGNWFDLATEYCKSFSELEKNLIFAETATNFYNI